jgi:hypothetical protein
VLLLLLLLLLLLCAICRRNGEETATPASPGGCAGFLFVCIGICDTGGWHSSAASWFGSSAVSKHLQASTLETQHARQRARLTGLHYVHEHKISKLHTKDLLQTAWQQCCHSCVNPQITGDNITCCGCAALQGASLGGFDSAASTFNPSALLQQDFPASSAGSRSDADVSMSAAADSAEVASSGLQENITTAYRYLVCGNTEVYTATSTAQVAAIVAKYKGTGKTIRALSHRQVVCHALIT